jgi:hypothetical protein
MVELSSSNSHIRDKKLEKRVIESKKNEEDDSLHESFELKLEHILEDIREKIFHEDKTVLVPELLPQNEQQQKNKNSK